MLDVDNEGKQWPVAVLNASRTSQWKLVARNLAPVNRKSQVYLLRWYKFHITTWDTVRLRHLMVWLFINFYQACQLLRLSTFIRGTVTLGGGWGWWKTLPRLTFPRTIGMSIQTVNYRKANIDYFKVAFYFIMTFNVSHPPTSQYLSWCTTIQINWCQPNGSLMVFRISNPYLLLL